MSVSNVGYFLKMSRRRRRRLDTNGSANDRKQNDFGVILINPHLPTGLSHPYQLDESIFHLRDVWCTLVFIFIIFLIEIPVRKQCRLRSERRVQPRLIWVCTVCLCPKNGTLGLYGLGKACISLNKTMQTKQQKESTMVVWCELKIASLRITIRLSRLSTMSLFDGCRSI